ncbi:hypothetical protein DACRYDRAFT_99555 [Dacryopinax primogenitus]|uniref:Large ribosomal subunit protein uL29m n=1 Tax=Dacryopinax primogenitus (strain DJM 731) TaxID=1858805 RepID=M5GB52_DACPD|nr:uncharacterized protein DACRYDRAFT_99555 [Dacryopinax primogenitus]EJU03237.1 hypothetical protein DACRYDRAFT_99555 [Dacryopinax primogenitus]
MSFLRRLPSFLPSPSTSRALPITFIRSYAVPRPSAYTNPPPPPKVPPPNPDGTLRPHLGVVTSPNHGLFGFFHRDKDDKVVTLEMRDKRTEFSGRSWSAPELRRKSFLDLHTLWYILIRERNVLHTQLEEWKKVGGKPEHFANIDKLNNRCRKSLARIKAILNERRLAFKQARRITAKVEKNRINTERRWARKAAATAGEAGAPVAETV